MRERWLFTGRPSPALVLVNAAWAQQDWAAGRKRNQPRPGSVGWFGRRRLTGPHPPHKPGAARAGSNLLLAARV